MTLKTVFLGAGDPRRAAVQAAHTRGVGDRPSATVEAVGILKLSEDLTRIAAVTIIYDTAPVRADFK